MKQKQARECKLDQKDLVYCKAFFEEREQMQGEE